jgi:hypothetical protein
MLPPGRVSRETIGSMNLKKIAATTIVAAGFPVLVDVAADPYADRGIIKSWFYGAGILAGAMIIDWASRESMFHVEQVAPRLGANAKPFSRPDPAEQR